MTALSDMRDRLVASLQLELAHRGLTDSVTVATAAADRALGDTKFEALTNYAAAADAAAVDLGVAWDTGVAPPTLAARRAAYASVRGGPIASDPVFGGGILPGVQNQ